jgi:mannose/fructose/N-acetylgalactosamine-specific phosphotransferase system component IIC
MDFDPVNLDPELRFARMYAIASAALGIISLCAAIIPICGSIASILGMLLGVISLKTEKSKTAIVGISISALGLLITIIYFILLAFFRK